MSSASTLNLANVPKELLLILEILKNKNNEDIHNLKSELFRGIDWDLFIKLSKHHRIYPILYKNLKKFNSDLIPPYVYKFLSVEYKRNTFKMLHLCAEIEYINKCFSEADIQLLFLKGPIIAHSVYGDISLRTSSDIDFLIPLSQLENAEALLANQGYIKDDYIKTVLNDWKWRHHHVTYFHPEKKIKLEIHWRLNPGPGNEPSFEELWRRKAKSNLFDAPTFFLGSEDLFLFLVSHGARHGWSRLRWLYDIHLMLELEINWQTTSTLLKKYQFHNLGAQALVLTSELLCSKVTNDMSLVSNHFRSKTLANDAIFYLERMVNLHTDPVPDDVSRYHSQHLFSLMTIRRKAVFLLSILHPYPEDVDVLPLPKKLHFLYFPLRPFIWIWKRTRKHALS
ncbi:nucleotidyltransferase family protein [Metabacillus litoralis]|uniref:nucleotidyltransferase domain-containing protein n=1 Tax=Metabacillus litoralis TaxID=152268 RepID=UPI001CFDBAFA|nr:nucleotidyltransferase family protein [Metabacillus litoralis]